MITKLFNWLLGYTPKSGTPEKTEGTRYVCVQSSTEVDRLDFNSWHKFLHEQRTNQWKATIKTSKFNP